MKKVLIAGLAILMLVIPFVQDAMAGVQVHAEGVYTDVNLIVYIYADIVGDPIVTGGVKLTYNISELTNPVAEKNEQLFFMGAGRPDYPYMTPEIADGSVVILVCKLDVNAPNAGVSGGSVLLGKVTFSRSSSTMPPVNPATTFGLGLTFARQGGAFANFVTVSGTNLDAGNVGFGNAMYWTQDAWPRRGNGSDYDSDGDGLSDLMEMAIGTNPLLVDTDGDGLSDYYEVAFDGNATAYTLGPDLNPLSSDTDGDGIIDPLDILPLAHHYLDGDIAPLGHPDGKADAADYALMMRIVQGEIIPTTLELTHADLYPAGKPDGILDISDAVLLLQLLK